MPNPFARPIAAIKAMFAGEPEVNTLFSHPLATVEALFHAKAASLAQALIAQIEASNPGVKIVVDEVVQLVHDHMGPAVALAMDHVLPPPVTVTGPALVATAPPTVVSAPPK